MAKHPRGSDPNPGGLVTDLLDAVERNLERIEDLREKLKELQGDMDAVHDAESREHPAAEPLARRERAIKARKSRPRR